MKLSVSILSMKDEVDIVEKIKKLTCFDVDYLHIDIMDGHFVLDKTWNVSNIETILKNNSKLLDIHLMVEDVKKYINDFSKLNPEYVTFHYEATNNPMNEINLIKQKN